MLLLLLVFLQWREDLGQFGVSKGIGAIREKVLGKPMKTGAEKLISTLGKKGGKYGGALSLVGAGVAAGGMYAAKKVFDRSAKNMQDNPYIDRRRLIQGQNMNDTPSIRRRLGASGDMVLRNAKF